MEINVFITAIMRYDCRPLGLEQGDKIKIAAFDEKTAMVKRATNINEFDKVFVKTGVGNLTESLTKSYIKLKDGHNWRYID